MPFKKKVSQFSSHAAHPIQSCIIIGPQSAEIQSSDCENDLASSLSTVEQPEVSLTGTNEDHGPYDIGSLFDPSKSMDDIITSIEKLSNDTKYSLLYNHVKPPSVCPSTLSDGVNRKFNDTWLKKYPWLLYSPKLNGVFCGPCSLFLIDCQRKDKGYFVNKPLKYHRDCLQIADAMKSTTEKSDMRVNSRKRLM